jgi:proliferating cell nuclear antigen
MPYCLEITTIQASAFKVLIEALKELLTDTNIEFDENGMSILAMDTSHVVLVHLKLNADRFETYKCTTKKTIGINMLNFHKLIKTINSNSTLTLFIDDDDINHLGIRIDNVEKNSRTTYKLNLLDLDHHPITIDPSEFSDVLTLPSCDFQKICRDMHNLADHMEIRSIGNQLIFSCNGDFCSQETIVNDSSAASGDSTDNNNIVQGIFSIKHLVLFTKCTNLCPSMELYLKNDYPLIIRYDVSSLGSVRLALAPHGANK